MADLKISQLTAGNPAQTNDEIPIARSGANFKITAGSISALPPTTAGANQVIYVDSAGTSLDGDANFVYTAATGRLGIGTASPTEALSVTRTSTTNAYANFRSGGSTSGVLVGAQNTSGDAILFAVDPVNLRLGTNNLERARIDTSGNLLVGTTTNTNSSRLVASGTISETVSSVQYLVASQFDVGTAPNQIPLNQYLGTMAFQDSTAVSVGQLRANTSSGIGYSTGAGGTVTQGTSRTTGVTLNTICGSITLFSAAGTTTWQSFTVTNSAVAATDTIIVNQRSGTDLNMIHVTNVAAGSFRISFATTGGTTTEQPVFNFAVIKAVTA